jgi:hypothetical protein
MALSQGCRILTPSWNTAGVVFDTTFAGFYPANEYYATYQVTDTRKYDALTAALSYTAGRSTTALGEGEEKKYD